MRELETLALRPSYAAWTIGTSLHVPDLGLIVVGDVAYNHCHVYVGATTAGIRAERITALGKLAALNPTAVVTGHKGLNGKRDLRF